MNFFRAKTAEAKYAHWLEDREKELVKRVLDPEVSKRTSEEAKTAIAYAEMCANDYDFWFQWNERRWLFWQRLAICMGVIATVVAVITVPLPQDQPIPYWVELAKSLTWLRAIPPAIATLALGVLGAFSYREDAVRHELTAHALWNELAKFQTRAEPYKDANEANDTSKFMNEVARLVELELRSWSAQTKNANPTPHTPPVGPSVVP